VVIIVDKALKTRVSNLVRKDLKKTPQYSKAKAKSFLGKAVYICNVCKGHFYTGASEKNFLRLKEEMYTDLIRCKESAFHMDHIEPVIPYDSSAEEMSIEDIIHRVYCFDNEDNFQYICKECHTGKTSKEKTLRSKYKKLKKLEEENE
jgi:5-methylcytosine-specific restriction endonuclease McrA